MISKKTRALRKSIVEGVFAFGAICLAGAAVGILLLMLKSAVYLLLGSIPSTLAVALVPAAIMAALHARRVYLKHAAEVEHVQV